MIEILVALLVLALVIVPVWTILKIVSLGSRSETAERRIARLERELDELRDKLRRSSATQPPSPIPTPTAPVPVPAPLPASTANVPVALPVPIIPAAPTPPVVTPAFAREAPPFISPPQPERSAVSAPAQPPILPANPPLLPTPPPIIWPERPAVPAFARQAPAPAERESIFSRINWEQFMGAKLFAWLGGLAALLGVAFFVKYSFDHGWVSPELRVAIGFVFGAGLIVGGVKLTRKGYTTPAQTLVATGIVSLYVVTFACRSIYDFEFFGPVPTFLLMTMITATAFILSVRLQAQVIAILGILGGFLAPKLVSTGADNPLGLFGYLALLNIGLAAVALHRRWFYLVPLGAAGTVLTMLGWAHYFYTPEKTLVAMSVCLGFSALFIGITEVARRWDREEPLLSQTATVLPVVAFGFAWHFLDYPMVADRTVLFFGYVFLVSLGFFFLAWRERRGGLIAGSAGVAAVLIIRWVGQTFTSAHTPVVMTVCLVFSAIYFVVYLLARRFDRATPAVLGAAVGMPVVALAFAFFLMNHAAVGARPGLLFAFILASDGLLLALAWLDKRLPKLHLVAGLSVFSLLSIWTANHLTHALLPWALAIYLLFAALHTVFPLMLERKRPAAVPTWWSQLFPPLTLLLMLLPIFKLETVSWLLWPAILLVDLIAIGLAVLSTSLISVAAVLVLTLLATGLCIFRVPATVMLAPSLLLVIGGFAVFFFAAGLWLVRKLGTKLPAANERLTTMFGDARAQLPAFASLLPFLLLIMVCARLAVPSPSAVFGLALLLVVLTLGLARLLIIEWLPACALAGVAALELIWHERHFDPSSASGPLFWHIGFYVVFAAYPFLFRREFARLTGPWAVAALSGLAHFLVIYQTIKAGWAHAWPRDFPGVVPALFALAPLVSLGLVLRGDPVDNPKRLNQLAWFGGVALFFITLIFPIQFERQWLTVAWAVEGAALLWLFHRVPHPGLRATGTVLLVIAFARLALNPAVFGYHVRGDTGIFNWYLYAYGVATAALFAGAALLAPPRQQVLGINAPPLLNTLGVILAFLLLNIEIADYFTAPGARSLAFRFSGHFARDMTYTIAWALFAFGLLVAGIWRQNRFARYAAIGLLSTALIKLFFHDLARLEALYRIGALFAVAVVAILASFAYQRFLPSHEKNAPPPPLS